MGSRVLSVLVCVLCVLLLPVVWAEYCTAYTDRNGIGHRTEQCAQYLFCCGTCVHKQCCNDGKYRLTQQQQQRCPTSPTDSNKKSRLSTLLGSILGSIFPIIICVVLVICCCAPCCLLYKKCRKGGNRGNQTPRNNNIINVPQQPPGPGYPGYQPVPAQPGFGGLPNPTAPPYMGTNHPSNPAPGGYPGMPMTNYPTHPYIPEPSVPYNPNYAQNP